MKKTCLTLIACFVIGHCFPQSIDSTTANTIDTTISMKGFVEKVPRPCVKIYPNPATNKISLQLSEFDPGMVTVKVIGIDGNQFRNDERLLITGTEEVVMFFLLPPGIYFIEVEQKEKIARKKLVVM